MKKNQGNLSHYLADTTKAEAPKKRTLGSRKFFKDFCATVWVDKAKDGTPKMNIWWQELVQGLLSHCLGGKRHRWDPKKLIYSGRNSFRDFCANVWAEKKAIGGAPRN